MANILQTGAKVILRRKKPRGGIVAFVGDQWLGEVDKIEPVRLGVGWVTIRVPLPNCTIKDDSGDFE